MEVPKNNNEPKEDEQTQHHKIRNQIKSLDEQEQRKEEGKESQINQFNKTHGTLKYKEIEIPKIVRLDFPLK